MSIATPPTATRREFLRLAALTSAGATIAPPQSLFGESRSILIPANAHPAIQSAARILAAKLNIGDAVQSYEGAPKPSAAAIVFALAASGDLAANLQPQNDGYTVLYESGTAVYGVRPRSLLYAAGEPENWLTAGPAPYLRNPSFVIRNTTFHHDRPVADQVAAVGANLFTAHLNAAPALQSLPEVFSQLSPADRKRLVVAGASHKEENAALVKQFHNADVEIFALLPYGNSFENWSAALYQATLKAYPTARGTSEPHSHETAALCPSDPSTWKVLEAFLREWAEQTCSDGLSATFWDAYGGFCQDPRCRQSGMNLFPNQLHAFMSHYYAVTKPLGQKLHVRTWSSGCAHWLGDNWVHAPGYQPYGLTHEQLWARVIHETPADILIQTKVYHSDCEPDPRFSTLLGKCAPHTEIVEYQITGQTLGRHYFPTSTVDYTARTLKQSLPLVGSHGGAQMDAGGTMQPGYDVFADILNSANVYAWRQLTWNVDADLDRIWIDWAKPIYGAKAAPAVCAYMRASEEAVYRCFSPLGHGSATNSDFAGSIERRETLLRYTNRYYLPEYAAFLEPTRENIDRMAKEKAACLQHIDTMAKALDSARPNLTPAQAAELSTRLDWLHQFAICNVTLDLSLWRFRYLRALALKRTTDPGQIEELASAWDLIEATTPKLFQFDSSLQFSCYKGTLGEMQRRPALGNPRSLMHQIYAESLGLVFAQAGPQAVPAAWLRARPKVLSPSEPPPLDHLG